MPIISAFSLLTLERCLKVEMANAKLQVLRVVKWTRKCANICTLQTRISYIFNGCLVKIEFVIHISPMVIANEMPLSQLDSNHTLFSQSH